MKILLNKEIKKDKWLSLLSNSKYASPFQTQLFYDFFNSMDNFSADVFAIEEDNEYKSLIVVTIQKEKGIKSYFSRRGIIYGGPLLKENTNSYLSPLLKEIKEYFKGKLIYIETRNYFDYSNEKGAFEVAGFNYIPWLNFQLDTSSDLSEIKKTMSKSRLRQIKKAIKNGAEWREAQSVEEVNIFYNILEDLYKNKVKKPIFDLSFFQEIYKKEIAKYLLVYFEDKVIGGIVCPIMPNKAIYEFYVCGLDTEYKDQYPSVMATWAAIEYANQHNIPVFDFMGAGSPDESYGVREFKSRFGGQEVELGRYVNILNPLLYRLGVFGLKILSKLRK